MNKNIKKLFLLMAVVVTAVVWFAFGVSAAEKYTEGDFTYTVENGEAIVEDYNGSGGAVIIPSELGGYTVTEIGDDAFSYCGGLKSVVIPDGVRTIDKYAFYKCKALESVEIPDGVTTIEGFAFYVCESLGSIEIPDSVMTIGEWAFAACRTLESIVIPGNVTTIGKSAFEGCSKLESIVISDSVTTICDRAFDNCNALKSIVVNENNDSYSSDEYGVLFNKDKTELLLYPSGNTRTEYIIPNSVKTIGYGAFSNCISFKSLVIPDGVTTIGEYAFSWCTNFESIKIPDSVATIGYSAFSYCDSLESVVILDGVTTIGEWAFSYCESLENIVIPSSVTTIGNGAFDGCMSLKEIYLPVSLERIGDTFYNCSGLTIYYAGDIYQWMKVEGWKTVSDYFDVITQPHSHSETILKGKNPTCTEEGLTEGVLCTTCSVITKKQIPIPSKGHTYTNACDADCNVCKAKRTPSAHKYDNSCDKSCNVCKATRSITHTPKTTTTKATLNKNGKQVTKCTVCGDVSKTTTIYYPKTIKLSATSYTYNGKAKKPSVTVKDSKGKTLKKDTDYTVKYSSGRKNPGKYTVTVTFKGKYSGTKKLSFTIKPKAVTLSKVTAGSKQLTANWKTVAAVTGYEVQASTSSKFTSKTTKKVTLKSAKTKKTTINKLKKGKKYYVKVRAYKTVDGKKIYGGWSKPKTVKVK